MEYCKHGDLKNYLQRIGTLEELETQEITLQVLGGLSLMHEAGFAHRDVKPAVRHQRTIIPTGSSLLTRGTRIY